MEVEGLLVHRFLKALISVGNFDKSCGFICGKADLEHWNPLEICHRYIHADKEYNIATFLWKNKRSCGSI